MPRIGPCKALFFTFFTIFGLKALSKRQENDSIHCLFARCNPGEDFQIRYALPNGNAQLMGIDDSYEWQTFPEPARGFGEEIFVPGR